MDGWMDACRSLERSEEWLKAGWCPILYDDVELGDGVGFLIHVGC